jgi:hypothetical protein
MHGQVLLLAIVRRRAAMHAQAHGLGCTAASALAYKSASSHLHAGRAEVGFAIRARRKRALQRLRLAVGQAVKQRALQALGRGGGAQAAHLHVRRACGAVVACGRRAREHAWLCRRQAPCRNVCRSMHAERACTCRPSTHRAAAQPQPHAARATCSCMTSALNLYCPRGWLEANTSSGAAARVTQPQASQLRVVLRGSAPRGMSGRRARGPCVCVCVCVGGCVCRAHHNATLSARTPSCAIMLVTHTRLSSSGAAAAAAEASAAAAGAAAAAAAAAAAVMPHLLGSATRTITYAPVRGICRRSGAWGWVGCGGDKAEQRAAWLRA